jgi:hypothetical protein
LQLSLIDWAGLAATSAGAALLYTLTGFGFAVLSTPAFLLFVDPSEAVQLVIIISTALSITALPQLWRAIAPALTPAADARQHRRVAAGAHCPPACRSGRRRPSANRSHDPGLYRGPRLGQAPRTGQEYGAAGHGTHSRPCGRRDIGYRSRARRNGGPAGPDLSVARRRPAANRARDTSLVFRDRLRGSIALPCGRGRHLHQHLDWGGRLDPLRHARRHCPATVSATVALPFSPSCFWPPPESTPLQRWPDLPSANNR